MRSTVVMLFVAVLVLTVGAEANCYAFQNNTNSTLDISFRYTGLTPPNAVLSASIAAYTLYPPNWQLCFSNTSALLLYAGSARMRRSDGQIWNGGFIVGDGPGAAPSGTYSIGP